MASLEAGASSLGQAASVLPLLMLVPSQPTSLPEVPRRARAVRHSPTGLSLLKYKRSCEGCGGAESQYLGGCCEALSVCQAGKKDGEKGVVRLSSSASGAG